MMGWIYTGISWILLKWNAAWHAIGVGDWLATNWDWILGIVFLVITIRAILFPVFVKQIKSQRAMQALQPEIAKLREQYKNDRAGLQQAQMQLMKDQGANPLMGCLPVVVQAPVFIGLFHVLRHVSHPFMSDTGKQLYGWTIGQFDSASHATLFGAPIAAAFRSTNADVAHLGSSATNVRVVAAMLMAIMIVTTFLTQFQMIKKTGWATDPNQKMIQRLMLFGVPVGLLFSGVYFPIGVVIYWVTTNLFSLGQQFYVLRKFPPPVNVDTGLGVNFFGRKHEEKTAAKGAGRKGQPAKAGTRNVKSGKSGTNGAPATKPTVAPPKVGAKPVNPKKRNAPAKRSS